MDRVGAYTMFATVAREGSFSEAARRLGVSAQAVTRSIAALETQLGVRLFHRSTRAVALTNEGADLLPRIQRVLADLAEAERAVAGTSGEPQGLLHLTAPVAFGQLHVMPVVNALLAAHPLLDVRLMLVDRNVRIIEEGIDAAVRIGQPADSSLRAIPLGSVRQVLVASPAYLAARGVPDRLTDLADHDVIASTGPRGAGEWRFAGRREGPQRSRLAVNSVAAALVATEAGIGIANLLSYQAAEALATGRLVEVLRPARPDLIPVNLLIEPGRIDHAPVRALAEAMRERARSTGWT
jgi:DNA-binding transcriptional LysR family regulator